MRSKVWTFLEFLIVRFYLFEDRRKLSGIVSFKKTTKRSPGSAAIKDGIPPLKLSGRIEKHKKCKSVKCRQISR